MYRNKKCLAQVLGYIGHRWSDKGEHRMALGRQISCFVTWPEVWCEVPCKYLNLWIETSRQENYFWTPQTLHDVTQQGIRGKTRITSACVAEKKIDDLGTDVTLFWLWSRPDRFCWPRQTRAFLNTGPWLEHIHTPATTFQWLCERTYTHIWAHTHIYTRTYTNTKMHSTQYTGSNLVS